MKYLALGLTCVLCGCVPAPTPGPGPSPVPPSAVEAICRDALQQLARDTAAACRDEAAALSGKTAATMNESLTDRLFQARERAFSPVGQYMQQRLGNGQYTETAAADVLQQLSRGFNKAAQ